MKKIFLLVLMVFLFSCKKNKEHQVLNLNKKEQVKKLEDKKYIYFLDFKYSDDYNIRYIGMRVLEKKSNKIIQTIDLKSIDIDIPLNLRFLTIEDVNFDGSNDIGIVSGIYAYSYSNSFWIFDKKTNQFVHNRKMDEIENPEIIKENKEICSKWHSGLSEFHLEKYIWNKDSLQLKESYEEFWTAENKGSLKILKLVNGKYEVQEKKIKDRLVENMQCK